MTLILRHADLNDGRETTINARIVGDPRTDDQITLLFKMEEEQDRPVRALVAAESAPIEVKASGDRQFSIWLIGNPRLDSMSSLNDSKVTLTRQTIASGNPSVPQLRPDRTRSRDDFVDLNFKVARGFRQRFERLAKRADMTGVDFLCQVLTTYERVQQRERL